MEVGAFSELLNLLTKWSRKRVRNISFAWLNFLLTTTAIFTREHSSNLYADIVLLEWIEISDKSMVEF